VIAIHLPSFDTVEDALDWIHQQGHVVRVTLLRGMDGLIRGNALIEPAPATEET
jgi:hypothetical protein